MFIADAITGIRRKRIESGGGTVALFIELFIELLISSHLVYSTVTVVYSMVSLSAGSTWRF